MAESNRGDQIEMTKGFYNSVMFSLRIRLLFSQRISRRSTKRKHLSDSNKLPYRISHILDQDHVPKEIQVENSWSDRDKSSNIYLHVSSKN